MRVHPREYLARAALGDYLASRGHLRVAAVLLEEARMFGADTGRIDHALVPLYLRLGDYRALSTLPSRITSPEVHAMALWLVEHAPAIRLRDSTTVTYTPAADTNDIGRVRVTVGESAVEASIFQRAMELPVVARSSVAAGARFGSTGVIDVALDSLGIGDLVLTNLPVIALEDAQTPSPAISIGLNTLAPYWPRFDPRSSRLTLSVGPPPDMSVWADTLPALLTRSGLQVVDEGRLVSIAADGRLRSHAWMYDQKRGVIWVSR